MAPSGTVGVTLRKTSPWLGRGFARSVEVCGIVFQQARCGERGRKAWRDYVVRFGDNREGLTNRLGKTLGPGHDAIPQKNRD
jgi:hypothetical protein